MGYANLKHTEPVFLTFTEPRNRFHGTDSASLCSLAGRYDHPTPTRFLAPIDCSKIPALASLSAANQQTDLHVDKYKSPLQKNGCFACFFHLNHANCEYNLQRAITPGTFAAS